MFSRSNSRTADVALVGFAAASFSLGGCLVDGPAPAALESKPNTAYLDTGKSAVGLVTRTQTGILSKEGDFFYVNGVHSNGNKIFRFHAQDAAIIDALNSKIGKPVSLSGVLVAESDTMAASQLPTLQLTRLSQIRPAQLP